MRKVHDEAALYACRHVLLKLGHVTGYIQWRRVPREWLARELAGYSQKALDELIAAHVESGGEIHQVVETRRDYTGGGSTMTFGCPSPIAAFTSKRCCVTSQILRIVKSLW